jgi:hypothetical protein
LDRPALKNVNSDYSDSCSSVSVGSRGSVDMDLDVMKRHVRRWKNEVNETAVAKLFREMVANGGRLENDETSKYFESPGAYNALTSIHMSNHNSVFRKDNSHHYVRQEAIDYYNSL